MTQTKNTADREPKLSADCVFWNMFCVKITLVLLIAFAAFVLIVFTLKIYDKHRNYEQEQGYDNISGYCFSC